jgi:NADH:ubiquinone oxidoreductase subunit E
MRHNHGTVDHNADLAGHSLVSAPADVSLAALHGVQDALSWLQADVLELVSAHLRVPARSRDRFVVP